MTDIVKQDKQLPAAITEQLAKCELPSSIQVGWYAYKTGNHSNDRGRKRVREITDEGIELERYIWITDSSRKEGGYWDWSHYGTISWHDLSHERYQRYHFVSPEQDAENDEYAIAILNGSITLEDLKKESEQIPDTTAITVVNKEELLRRKQAAIDQVHSVAAVMHKVRDIMFERRAQMELVVAEMNELVSRLREAIFTIELYLGINRGMKQIASGEPAPSDTPISFRQMRLYMDEEVGDPTNEGLSFSKIEAFDDWLSEHHDYFDCQNIDILLPEKKGVVAMRVRREQRRHRDRSPFESFNRLAANEGDMYTYLLIRNGENFYRVWDEMDFSEQLFPGKEELMNMQQEIESETSRWDRERIEKAMKTAIGKYKIQLIAMQGLIDNSDVFLPYDRRVNLLNAASIEDPLINFVYDGDDSRKIHDSQFSFHKWKQEFWCPKPVQGMRILLLDHGYSRIDEDRYGSYFSEKQMTKTFEHGYNLPDPPECGVLYSVEEFVPKPGSEYYQERDGENQQVFPTFLYLPGDEIYSRDRWGNETYGPRKRKYRWKLKGCTWVDWDMLDPEHLDGLESLMHDRVNRKHYLSMCSAFLWIIKLKRAEIEEERPFVQLLADRSMSTFEEAELAARLWKRKNKWKRKLDSDTSKAFRMILKYLKTGKW